MAIYGYKQDVQEKFSNTTDDILYSLWDSHRPELYSLLSNYPVAAGSIQLEPFQIGLSGKLLLQYFCEPENTPDTAIIEIRTSPGRHAFNEIVVDDETIQLVVSDKDADSISLTDFVPGTWVQVTFNNNSVETGSISIEALV